MWFSKSKSTKIPISLKFTLFAEEYSKEKHDKNPVRINWFKMYGYSDQSQNQPVIEPMIDESMEEQPKEDANKGGAGEGELQEISCSICTYLNLSINTNCEMCGEKL